jgi:uncharacterized protein YbaA (DUF1428 family)
MPYVDGFVAAVPTENRETYRLYATEAASAFREHGAVRIVECWGDDVPEGKLTDFHMAVKREADETIVFAWIEWPSKDVRDAAFAKIMADPRFDPANNPMPFDGKRMIYGGFSTLLDVGA